MANIKAFKATIPDPNWFDRLLANRQTKLCELKNDLEAKGVQVITSQERKRIRERFSGLINEKFLRTDQHPAIYVYGFESAHGVQYGLCALTAVDDYRGEQILRHEKTISDKQKRLSEYRKKIAIDNTPVLLLHKPHYRLTEIITSVTTHFKPLKYLEDGNNHYIWKITNGVLVDEIVEIFSRIGNVYIGDGHHRLAAAARLRGSRPNFVSSLYVSTTQMKISAFDRLVLPLESLDREFFFLFIKKFFFISEVPSNVPYRPDRAKRFGLSYNGDWYQLDLKPALKELFSCPDVMIIQDKILNELLGIKDPQVDNRLVCYAQSDFSDLLKHAASANESLIFTVYSLNINTLIECAEDERMLPPKSSYIEPKVPFGLFINLHDSQ